MYSICTMTLSSASGPHASSAKARSLDVARGLSGTSAAAKRAEPVQTVITCGELAARPASCPVHWSFPIRVRVPEPPGISKTPLGPISSGPTASTQTPPSSTFTPGPSREKSSTRAPSALMNTSKVPKTSKGSNLSNTTITTILISIDIQAGLIDPHRRFQALTPPEPEPPPPVEGDGIICW